MSQIHDHPEQGCVMKIVQGCLIEDIYTNLNNTHAKLIQRNYLNINGLASKSSNKILHKITNNESISVSIHIYFPPKYQSNIYKEYENIINHDADDENEIIDWNSNTTPKEIKKYFNCGCCDNCECDDNKACTNCNCNCNCDEIEDECDYESDDNLTIHPTKTDTKNTSLNINDFSISVVNKKEKKVRISLELMFKQELISINFDINKLTYLKIADELI